MSHCQTIQTSMIQLQNGQVVENFIYLLFMFYKKIITQKEVWCKGFQ